MPIDIEGARLEGTLWTATPELRWRRPKGGDDNDLILEQLFERITGERDWRPVQKMFED